MCENRSVFFSCITGEGIKLGDYVKQKSWWGICEWRERKGLCHTCLLRGHICNPCLLWKNPLSLSVYMCSKLLEIKEEDEALHLIFQPEFFTLAPAWRGAELSRVAGRQPGCPAGLWRLMWRGSKPRGSIIVLSLPWFYLRCWSMLGNHKGSGYTASHHEHQLCMCAGKAFDFFLVTRGKIESSLLRLRFLNP